MNTLALFEAVLKAAHNQDAEAHLRERLASLGRGYGMSWDEVERAEYSDRMLVIYEP